MMLVAIAGLVPAAASAQTASAPLTTFTLEKPADVRAAERAAAAPAPPAPTVLPRDRDVLKATLGLGYLQDADWGSEVRAYGDVRGHQVAFDGLFTDGPHSLQFDHGSGSVADPDRGWRLEGGDIFSSLRGASRGGRFTMRLFGLRPSIAILTPRFPTLIAGSVDRRRLTVATYRDSVHLFPGNTFDMEVASDGSYFGSLLFNLPRVTFQATHRRNQPPVDNIDTSTMLDIRIARGLTLGGGVLWSDEQGQQSRWETVSLRLPLGHRVSLTLERAYVRSADSSNATSSISGVVGSGRMQLFHRYQWGRTDLRYLSDVDGPAYLSMTLDRQQAQSMAHIAAGSRLNFTFQVASAWSPRGAVQTWEELQTSWRASKYTTVELVTSVPDFGNMQRMRARVVQQLPYAFALEADYGRLSAYQAIPYELDRSRAKLMLSRTFGVSSPARGGELRGVVVDHAGHSVAGARVVAGDYATYTDKDGRYVFEHLPRGQYDLALDPNQLPANYAWDGRREHLDVSFSSRINANLHVAPLNSIHGRVYHDTNLNGRYDTGEGLPGVVVALEGRVVATDRDGGYSFFNVWPGARTLTLVTSRLPQGYVAGTTTSRDVTLSDEGPVTNADFQLLRKERPIVWREPIK